MLSESVLTALNWQLNHEQTNAQTYLMFSAIMDFNGLTGATSWFAKQSAEETGHAQKILSYICDCGHIPSMLIIPEIKPEIVGMQDLFQRSVDLEASTTASLKAVASIAKAEQDDQTYLLMLEMLKEQVEEEKLVGDALRQVMFSAGNLMVIDKILGER